MFSMTVYGNICCMILFGKYCCIHIIRSMQCQKRAFSSLLEFVTTMNKRMHAEDLIFLVIFTVLCGAKVYKHTRRVFI